jgi:hypothetical protein
MEQTKGKLKMPNMTESLVGHTFTHVYKNEDYELVFVRSDGMTFMFYHEQDCCEDVNIEDINGNLDDLMNTPILVADERISDDVDGDYESATWTFYTFRTIKGSVDVRWLGSSNGYYSEGVSFGKKENQNAS